MASRWASTTSPSYLDRLLDVDPGVSKYSALPHWSLDECTGFKLGFLWLHVLVIWMKPSVYRRFLTDSFIIQPSGRWHPRTGSTVPSRQALLSTKAQRSTRCGAFRRLGRRFLLRDNCTTVLGVVVILSPQNSHSPARDHDLSPNAHLKTSKDVKAHVQIHARDRLSMEFRHLNLNPSKRGMLPLLLLRVPYRAAARNEDAPLGSPLHFGLSPSSGFGERKIQSASWQWHVMICPCSPTANSIRTAALFSSLMKRPMALWLHSPLPCLL